VYSGRRFWLFRSDGRGTAVWRYVNLRGRDHQLESLAGGQRHGLTPSVERSVDHTWKAGFVADRRKQSAEAVRVIWDLLCVIHYVCDQRSRGAR
jgi:hypothetical protein